MCSNDRLLGCIMRRVRNVAKWVILGAGKSEMTCF
jgi:hypothetical protein